MHTFKIISIVTLVAALSIAFEATAQDYTKPLVNPFGLSTDTNDKKENTSNTEEQSNANETTVRSNPTGGQISDQEFNGLVVGSDRRGVGATSSR